MCGSEQNLHVDRVWMDVCLKQQGDDGLIYIPVKGRPWVLEGHPEYISGGIPDIDQWISPFMNGQMLRNMSGYAARDGSVFWPDRIRRIVDGLTALAVDGGEFAYFWPGAHSAHGRPFGTEDLPAECQAAVTFLTGRGVYGDARLDPRLQADRL